MTNARSSAYRQRCVGTLAISWLLPKVVAHEIGDPGVDDLVVGDSGAGGVGDGDAPRLPRPHQSRDTERRIRTERLGVEEQVVDPAVDHVDGLETVDRPHEHAVVVGDDEVGALNERGAHALGEEGVLEVRRVEDPRREDDDARIGDLVRCQRDEQLGQLLRVGVDGGDPLPREHLGKRPLGDRPILQHVADPRGHAQVVLEHVHGAVGVAHEIRPGDVRPHTEPRLDALALGAEVDRAVEQLPREHAIGDHPLVVVDVVDEPIEGDEALLESLGDARPLAGLDDPGDDVEGPGAVDARDRRSTR